MRGEVEERSLVNELVLEVVALRRFYFFVRRDAAAALAGAAGVGHLHFTVG